MTNTKKSPKKVKETYTSKEFTDFFDWLDGEFMKPNRKLQIGLAKTMLEKAYEAYFRKNVKKYLTLHMMDSAVFKKFKMGSKRNMMEQLIVNMMSIWEDKLYKGPNGILRHFQNFASLKEEQYDNLKNYFMSPNGDPEYVMVDILGLLDDKVSSNAPLPESSSPETPEVFNPNEGPSGIRKQNKKPTTERPPEKKGSIARQIGKNAAIAAGGAFLMGAHQHKSLFGLAAGAALFTKGVIQYSKEQRAAKEKEEDKDQNKRSEQSSPEGAEEGQQEGQESVLQDIKRDQETTKTSPKKPSLWARFKESVANRLKRSSESPVAKTSQTETILKKNRENEKMLDLLKKIEKNTRKEVTKKEDGFLSKILAAIMMIVPAILTMGGKLLMMLGKLFGIKALTNFGGRMIDRATRIRETRNAGRTPSGDAPGVRRTPRGPTVEPSIPGGDAPGVRRTPRGPTVEPSIPGGDAPGVRRTPRGPTVEPSIPGGAGEVPTKVDPKTGQPVEPKPTGKGSWLKKIGRVGGGLFGAALGIAGGWALDKATEHYEEEANKSGATEEEKRVANNKAATTDIASSALSGAGLGASVGMFLGPVGAAVGGAVGGAIGAGIGVVSNYNRINLSSKTASDLKKPAATSGSSIASAIIPKENETGDDLNTIESVVESGKGYIVVKTWGGKTIRKTGTVAWRNNNPGNIRYNGANSWAAKHGAVGGDKGGFAVFPSLAIGKKAQEDLFFGPTYQKLTLSEAVHKWAPPNENNTKVYQKVMINAVGADKKMSEYSSEEREALMATMRNHEGFNVSLRNGRIQDLGGDDKKSMSTPTPIGGNQESVSPSASKNSGGSQGEPEKNVSPLGEFDTGRSDAVAPTPVAASSSSLTTPSVSGTPTVAPSPMKNPQAIVPTVSSKTAPTQNNTIVNAPTTNVNQSNDKYVGAGDPRSGDSTLQRMFDRKLSVA
jgi:hypothetical protein